MRHAADWYALGSAMYGTPSCEGITRRRALLYSCGALWSSEGGSDPTGSVIPPLDEVERATGKTCELSPEFEASIFRGRKGG